MIAAIPQDFIKNSLSYLYTVVQKLERDNIQTVEALLIHFTGEVNAGRMLNRLLFWWPKFLIAAIAGGIGKKVVESPTSNSYPLNIEPLTQRGRWLSLYSYRKTTRRIT